MGFIATYKIILGNIGTFSSLKELQLKLKFGFYNQI